MDKPVSTMPIMEACCKTCPFKLNADGRYQNPELVARVVDRNLFQSQQICHHPRTVDKPETHRCRGYYDYAFVIYERMGLNPEENIIK